MRYMLILGLFYAFTLAQVQTIDSRIVAETVDRPQSQLGPRDEDTDRSGSRRVRAEKRAEASETPLAVDSPQAKVASIFRGNTSCPYCPDDCCDSCTCPLKDVCTNGDCKRNYLLYFGATWCGPCKRMKPTLHKLEQQGYIVYHVDIDQHPEVARQFRVRAVPSMVIMDQGQSTNTFTGITDIRSLKRYLKTREEQVSE